MKKSKHLIVIYAVVIVLLIIGSNAILYYKISKDYRNNINKLDAKLSSALTATKNSLLGAIGNESSYSAHQREVLENNTFENFRNLQDFINAETSKLKLNLESQLSDVATDLEQVKTKTESELKNISQKVGGLEEKSLELEDRISELDVTSSDFSSIIDDVIMAVVSVKTNLGQGSGVFFDKRGYIMTNKHVIEGAQTIQAVDYNQNIYSAKVLGYATNTDLAVLKIDSDRTFNYLKFEDLSNIRVGTRVIAVGNPLGLSFTVTEGIISATNRQIDSTGVGYIQTDVPINRGNSGGPLVNAAKKVVGINTFKIAYTEGLGFAIPSDLAQDIAEQAVS